MNFVQRSTEIALVQQLLDNTANSTSVRPTSPTMLLVSFSIVKTLQLSTNGLLTLSSMMALCWFDWRLRWNASAYGLDTTSLPVAKIWTPTLTLINSASASDPVIPSSATNVMVFNNGTVVMPFSVQLTSTCTLDLAAFPFDSQSCVLKFTSLDANLRLPMAVFIANDSILSMNLYSQTGEFYLKKMSIATSNATTPSFCFFQLCYATMNITLSYVRKPAYYITAMITPAITICVLLAFAYLIPSENSVKITVSCTLMVSLYTLQQSVARVLPASAESSYLSTGLTSAVIFAGVTVLVVTMQVSVKILGPGFFANCFGLCPSANVNVSEQQNGTGIIKLESQNRKAANVVYPMQVELQSKVANSTTNAFSADCDDILDLSSGPSDKAFCSSNLQVQLALLHLLQTQVKSIKETQKKERTNAEKQNKWRKIDTIINALLFIICLCVTAVVLFSNIGTR